MIFSVILKMVQSNVHYVGFCIIVWNLCNTNIAMLDLYWTNPILGCIRGYNEIIIRHISTVEECMVKCEEETSVSCVSIDYKVMDTGTCYLQTVRSSDVGLDYKVPCNTDPGNQFAERGKQLLYL